MPSLLRGFTQSVETNPDRPALQLDEHCYSYAELAEVGATIADAIGDVAPTRGPLAGVFAANSLTAYAGVIGILAAGRGYVPVHPEFPPQRIRDVVDRSGVDVLVVGQEALEGLNTVLEQRASPLAVIAPQIDDLGPWARRHPRHRFLSAGALRHHRPPLELPQVAGDDTAYLLFTSGSTGTPKGVPVTHRNARAYVDYICHAYGIEPDDRVSQTFKLAFDLSVHDIFTTWSAGACLYPLAKRHRMAPGRFIREHELTRWFSVPTLAMTMDRFRQLKPNAFPSLRTSLFCGEPLPASIADKWADAAPNSTVDNLYGPTEATIAITAYRWDDTDCPDDCVNGVVPIGRAFPGQKAMVVDDKMQPVEPGEIGELLLAGSQLTPGYWKAPGITRDRYVYLQHTGDRRWYRTGDLVHRDQRGCLHFVGRVDDQVQIQGHRVELTEIDHALREGCGHDMAVSVAWPCEADEVGGVVGFVAGDANADTQKLTDHCRRCLPDYMVPSRIVQLQDLPRNTSGKIDRTELTRMLDDGEV